MVTDSHRVAVPATAGAATVLDAAALARLRELDPTGQSDLVARVLKAYQSSAARLMPQLESARLAGHRAEVQLVAHTLKSSSASIGALRLSVLCAQVEALIRNETTDGLEEGIAAMTHAMADTLQAIERLLESKP